MTDYQWEIGERVRFCLSVEVKDQHSFYSAHFFNNKTKHWQYMATFKALTGGQYLRGFYSFVEDFTGQIAHKYARKAHYGNNWVQDKDGNWTELTRVAFSQAGKLKNVDAGVEDNHFYMKTGAATRNTNPVGSKLNREPTGKPPTKLPELPVKIKS